ncbi:MAG TPA: TolC family protein, partial [Parachlamydiaceae bacterium]|nr:TolC family protein [Parachlamydiaceae bacterium]
LLIAQKPQLEYLIDRSVNHLSILLGNLPGDLYCELAETMPLPILPCYQPMGIPSELLRRRPDIRKAERDLAAATEEVGTAIAALFPRISLTGFIGDITTFCTSGSLTGFVGPQLLLPIFNSRLLKQDVCLNKIKVGQAFLQYQKTVLEALEETENAISAFHNELEKKELLKRLKISSEEAYQLSMQLYQSGLKNYLEVQLAQRSYLGAESALLQSQIDGLVNYIALYKALGGGWDRFSCELNTSCTQ